MKRIMFFVPFSKDMRKTKYIRKNKMNKLTCYERFIYSIHFANIRANVEL